MKKIKLLIIFFLIVVYHLSLNAQIKPSVHFTEDDGLPGNAVRDIIKDKNGILWIATDNGIAKFDGDKYINIKNITGLPLNMVWALAQNQENEIYAGLYKGGLAIIRNDSVIRIIHNKDRAHDQVRKLFYSNYYKKLLVGTENGLFILTDTTFIPVFFTRNDDIKSVILSISSNDSLIYFSVEGPHHDGIYRLYLNKNELEKSFALKISKQGHYSCLLNGDTLYGGAFDTLYRFNAKNPQIKYRSSKIDSTLFIWNIAPYKDGKIWIGGLGEGRFKGGIIIYDTKKSSSKPLALKQNFQSVNAIFYDTTSRVTWFGRDNGLTAALESPFEYVEKNGNETILDIGFAGDSLLVLTENGVYYPKWNSMVPVISKEQIMTKINYWLNIYNKNPGKNAHLILDNAKYCELVSFVQNKRRLFISTQRGAISVPDMKSYVPFAVGTFSLVNNYSAYSFVNYNPLRFYPSFKDSLGSVIPDGPGGKVFDISKLIESNGIFYCISNMRGLYALENNTVFRLSEENSTIDNYLIDMDKDKESNIWCSSINGNLFEIGFSDSIFIKRKVDLYKSGLNGSSLKWIKFNGDYLLIGTNKGLNVIRLRELYSDHPVIEHFYNNFNGYDFISAGSPMADGNGKIYVHTLHDVIGIDTNFVRYPSGRLYTDNLIINGRPVDLITLNGKILPFSKKQIYFRFNAIKFPLSRNLVYRYKVNKGDWIPGNQVSLPSLRAGKYEIEMEGFDKENMGQVSGTVSFTVRLPLWRSFWFIFISTLSLAVLVYLVMRLRIRNLKRQHEEKTKLVIQNSELQLRSLQMQMNPHFIFNALQSIQNFVLTKSVEEALTYIGILSEIIRSNLENASEEYIPLSDEIEFLRKYVAIEKMRFKDMLNVEFCNTAQDSDLMIPPMLIQPIIENAIKHGIRNRKEQGVIKVDFSQRNDFLAITIEDNGVGREYTKTLKTNESNGRGLKIITQRLTLLNELTHTNIHNITFYNLYDDMKPSGTKVILTLLLRHS